MATHTATVAFDHLVKKVVTDPRGSMGSTLKSVVIAMFVGVTQGGMSDLVTVAKGQQEGRG